MPELISIGDVRTAAARLAGVAHRTPVLTSRTLDERLDASIHVKAESFQRGGAFKFRGAYNKISSLPDDVRSRGVLAYSSGNHAQAVAIAARLHGTSATIVMPEDTPPAKLDATRGYGAEIVTYDRWTEQREEIGLRRWGTPREFGDVVCFLASARAAYVTGQTLVVDGGLKRFLF